MGFFHHAIHSVAHAVKNVAKGVEHTADNIVSTVAPNTVNGIENTASAVGHLVSHPTIHNVENVVHSAASTTLDPLRDMATDTVNTLHGVGHVAEEAAHGVGHVAEEAAHGVGHIVNNIKPETKKVDLNGPAFDRLKWDKALYNKWHSIFGPIEDNIADFYLHATPDTYTQPVDEAIQNAVHTLHSNLYYYDKLNQSQLETRAPIGMNDKIAGDKFNYLAQGMRLQSPLLNNVNQSSNELTAAGRNIHNLHEQQMLSNTRNIAGLLSAGAMLAAM